MLGIGGDRGFATVLLIDDDMISREVIATLLTLQWIHAPYGRSTALQP